MNDSIITYDDLELALFGILPKYNIFYENGPPFEIEIQDDSGLINIDINIGVFTLYKKLISETTKPFNLHFKLCDCFQELIDLEIIPHKIINHQYRFKYLKPNDNDNTKAYFITR